MRSHMLLPMRLWRNLFFVAAFALVAVGLGPSSTSADVDPASDVLLLQDVFVPYHPKVCSGVANALRDLTKKSKQAGYPIKVAVIGARSDLGGAPQLYKKPKDYAQFLGYELGVYGRDVGRNYSMNLSLLIVMPNGVALAHSRKNATPGPTGNPPAPISGVPPALANVSIPANADNNALARIALSAIPKLAKAAGHPVAPANASIKCSGGGGGGSSAALIFGAPILVLVAAAGGFAGFQRLRARRAG